MTGTKSAGVGCWLAIPGGVNVRGVTTKLAAGLLGLAGLLTGAAGCVDRTPPPPDAPVPLGEGEGRRPYERVKPMPGPEDEEFGAEMPPPPFNDVPLVVQETPEQRVFVEAYQAVGRPRIVVFVNRTLQGELLPVNDAEPLVSVERNRTSRGDVSVESRNRRYSDDFRSRDDRDTTERFESRGGPGEYRDRTDVYLRPGQYDEALARSVDYEAIENVLTDWLAAGGQTEIVSPAAVRRELTADALKDLERGERRSMTELVRTLDADVLVQVTARPTRQTRRGLEVRLVAEAINAEGGQSIGRAVVDIPPPLDKPRINKFTRFLARKLMDGMIGTWESSPPDERDDRESRDPRGDAPPDPRRAAPPAPPATERPAPRAVEPQSRPEDAPLLEPLDDDPPADPADAPNDAPDAGAESAGVESPAE